MGESYQIKPSYLLPHGCKVLIDAMRLATKDRPPGPFLPPVYAWVFLPEKVSVRYIADLTGQHLFVIQSLMSKLRILWSCHRSIDFSDAARLLRLHGIEAQPAELA